MPEAGRVARGAQSAKALVALKAPEMLEEDARDELIPRHVGSQRNRGGIRVAEKGRVSDKADFVSPLPSEPLRRPPRSPGKCPQQREIALTDRTSSPLCQLVPTFVCLPFFRRATRFDGARGAALALRPRSIRRLHGCGAEGFPKPAVVYLGCFGKAR